MNPTANHHHESNRAFYDRISAACDQIADANERTARLKGLELLAVQPGERVLEIGFGTGRPANRSRYKSVHRSDDSLN